MTDKDHSFIKNAQNLRWRLAQAYNECENGDMKTGQAKELANIAGKMINSAKAQLEYYALQKKEPPKMDFLEEVE
tara:strand:- start:559 stop:783 length:225 start_codon:yes stop_codon:yes gene_type:complete